MAIICCGGAGRALLSVVPERVRETTNSTSKLG